MRFISALSWKCYRYIPRWTVREETGGLISILSWRWYTELWSPLNFVILSSTNLDICGKIRRENFWTVSYAFLFLNRVEHLRTAIKFSLWGRDFFWKIYPHLKAFPPSSYTTSPNNVDNTMNFWLFLKKLFRKVPFSIFLRTMWFVLPVGIHCQGIWKSVRWYQMQQRSRHFWCLYWSKLQGELLIWTRATLTWGVNKILHVMHIKLFPQCDEHLFFSVPGVRNH